MILSRVFFFFFHVWELIYHLEEKLWKEMQMDWLTLMKHFQWREEKERPSGALQDSYVGDTQRRTRDWRLFEGLQKKKNDFFSSFTLPTTFWYSTVAEFPSPLEVGKT